MQHELVQQAAVAVQKDDAGEQRLVAYVVGFQDTLLDDKMLRDYLKGILPNYMVPSVFVKLDALPLTASGKVNRAALPRPEFDRISRVEFVPPNTETELRIAAIWQEILHVNKVGIHDDFFALGGHSLSATQVISRLNEVFSVKVPVLTFFEHATIHGLSSILTDPALSEDTMGDGDESITRTAGEYQDSYLDALSDEQVGSMLAELMNQEDPGA